MPSDTSKDYYYIIRDTPNNETIIIEYGFLDNAADAEKLKNNYEKYAEAVVKALTTYAGYQYIPVANSGYYVVKKGDSLWNIAKTYGLTVEKLKEINNLSSNTLNIGDVLLIKQENTTQPPSTSENYQYHTVVKGDTLYNIAHRYNTTVDTLIKNNNLKSNTLSIGQKIIISQNAPSSTYTIKKGDTLYSIAKAFNTTVDSIKSTNNLTNNTLTIGKQLIIPTQTSSTTQTTRKYTIKKGDTLYNIAKTFNTSVTEIKKLNALNSNILTIGQELIIPS